MGTGLRGHQGSILILLQIMKMQLFLYWCVLDIFHTKKLIEGFFFKPLSSLSTSLCSSHSTFAHACPLPDAPLCAWWIPVHVSRLGSSVASSQKPPLTPWVVTAVLCFLLYPVDGFDSL